MNKEYYMQPVPQEDKKAVIKALKSLITDIENSDTMFGLLLNYSRVKKVDEHEDDMNIGVQTHNLLVGNHTLIANNLSRNLKNKIDYREVFARMSDFL